MPLNDNILGAALHTARSSFNDRTYEDLIAEFGTLDAIRTEAGKREAAAFNTHLKVNANVVGNVTTTGTASAQTGTITANTGKIQ